MFLSFSNFESRKVQNLQTLKIKAPFKKKLIYREPNILPFSYVETTLPDSWNFGFSPNIKS